MPTTPIWSELETARDRSRAILDLISETGIPFDRATLVALVYLAVSTARRVRFPLTATLELVTMTWTQKAAADTFRSEATNEMVHG